MAIIDRETLDDVGTAAAVAAVAAEIWGRLNTARTVLIEVDNRTSFPLRVQSHDHAHGGFEEPPDPEIPGNAISVFGSQSSGGSIFTGTEGRVTYSVERASALFTVRWNNPFVGSNDCRASVAGEKASAFDPGHICGAGNDAQMKYELRQIHDLRLVRSPDYVFVRLEGYLPPNEGGPDDVPSFNGHRVERLASFWSPGREDNFATSDISLRNQREFSPDYVWYRDEGYVFSSAAEPPAGTVPLHSWYSDERGDNWATTNPAYTRPVRSRIDPSYRHYRHEGYVFDPAKEPPRGTTSLYSWYSPSRGDNFLTADPIYSP